MHSSKITLISDQSVSFKGEELNTHHIQSIVIDEEFKVVEVIKKSPDVIRQEEIELKAILKNKA